MFLKQWLRDVLIDHMLAGGRIPIVETHSRGRMKREYSPMATLGCLEIIRTPGGTVTEITTKGRKELAQHLADYAETLIRTGAANIEGECLFVVPLKSIWRLDRGRTRPRIKPDPDHLILQDFSASGNNIIAQI